MKRTILNFAATMLMATAICTSCKSPEEKVADAQSSVVDANQNLKDVRKDSGVAAAKAATADEWKMFKNDADATIKNNEIRITELKAKMKKSTDASYAKRVDDLEQQNTNLKIKIDAYDKNHSDWEAFKQQFSQDVNNFGQALKDLTNSNKK